MTKHGWKAIIGPKLYKKWGIKSQLFLHSDWKKKYLLSTLGMTWAYHYMRQEHTYLLGVVIELYDVYNRFFNVKNKIDQLTNCHLVYGNAVNK